MPALQRREPVAAVLVGVLLAADPEQTAVEEADREPRTRSLESQLPSRALAELARSFGSARANVEHLVELLPVALLAPDGVVEVLAPPGGIGADGLQVAVREPADPDVGPGRRDRERLDPLELDWVREPVAALVDVRETTPATASPVAGLAAVDVAQPGHAGCSSPSSCA